MDNTNLVETEYGLTQNSITQELNNFLDNFFRNLPVIDIDVFDYIIDENGFNLHMVNIELNNNDTARSVDINELTVDEVTEKNENECSICLNNYEIGDVFIHTKCKHMFHYKCLEQWVSDHSECPNCRSDLSNVNN
jgi:hypothetical protein